MTNTDTLPADAAELPLFDLLPDCSIRMVVTEADAQSALSDIFSSAVVGFDTESKPTFAKGEVRTGPHLIQVSTERATWLFRTANPSAMAAARRILESPTPVKAGFGLRDDLSMLSANLGVTCSGVLDLAVALRPAGDTRDVGAKAAVARFFGARMRKSKRTSTSDWSLQKLSRRQITYAANDAWVALRVHAEWLSSAPGSSSGGPPPHEAPPPD